MPETFVGPFDRFDIALTNAVTGNFAGSGRALIAPDTLAPAERQRAVERLFGITDPGPLKELIATTTNPTVILGGILTLKYPIKLSRNYLSESEQFNKGLRRLLPIYDHIADFGELYRGTPLPKLLYKLGERTHHFHKQATDMLNAAAEDYYKVSGKIADAVSERRVVYERLRRSGALAEQLENFAKKMDKYDVVRAGQIRESAKQLIPLQLTDAEKALDDGWTRFFKFAAEKTGADNVDGVARQFQRRHAGLVQVGGTLDSADYWPLITKWNTQQARAINEAYMSGLLEGGKKISGLRIAGPNGQNVTPSEMYRLLEDFITDETVKNLKPGSKEFWEAFNTHVQGLVQDTTAGITGKIASGTQAIRLNRMVIDPDVLKSLGPEFEGVGNIIGENLDKFSQYARAAGKIELPDVHVRVFRLDGTPTARIYSQMRARDYAWAVTPDGWDATVGERFNAELKALKTGVKRDLAGNIVATGTRRLGIGGIVSGNEAVRVAALQDTYIPAIMGMESYDNTIRSAWWDGLRVRVADSLNIVKEDGKIVEAASGKLGLALEKLGAGKFRDSLMNGILSDSRYAMKQATGKVAGYFYQSTLALPNVLAPARNLFQTIIATAPRIGIGNTISGVRRVAEGAETYITKRLGEGLSHENAFTAAFPEFRESGLALDQGLLKSLDRIHEGFSAPGSLEANLDRLKQLSMSLFSGSESFNRLTAYYGARKAATDMYWGLASKGEAVDYFATGAKVLLPKVKSEFLADSRLREMVHAVAQAVAHDTQGGGGIATIPKVLEALPGPLRQLIQFPIRYASQLLHSGAGEVGMALLLSGATVGILGSIFGAEGKKIASDATFFGALPSPTDQGPFAPFPFVPPVLQLAGSAAQGLATGDFGNLQRSLPLLVPGGIGFQRIAPMLGNQTISQWLGKPVADYDNTTPDGRVPMYDANNKLQGFYTPTQLFARSIGIGDINSTQSMALAKWMEGYGSRITAMRHDYMAALQANDQRTADAIAAEYEKLNPGTGGLQLKRQQILAMQATRDVTTLERRLEMLPPEIRSQFSAAAAVAFGQSGGDFLGVPMETLASMPTIRSRNPYRLQPATPQIGTAPSGDARVNALLQNTSLNAFGAR